MSEKKKQFLKAGIFFIYLAAVLFLVSRHENWRDEAQAWLLARDLDLPGLVSMMKYEGHPCLWHLILMPFAKLGFPYRSMNLISTALVAAAVWLMLFRSPLPLPLQCLALAGSALLYYFPVVSRSYSLIPLFLFLSALFYSERRKRPFLYGFSLALLVQTHLYMIPIAGMLSLFWFFEALAAWRKDRDGKVLLRQALGLLLPLVSFLLFLVQISGAEESSAFVPGWDNVLHLYTTLFNNNLIIGRAFPTTDFLQQRPRLFCFLILLVLFVPAFISCLIAGFRRDWESVKCCLLYLLFVSFQLFFYVLLPGLAGMRKTSILALLPIWLLWVIWPRIKSRLAIETIQVLGYCAVALLFVLFDPYVLWDVRYPYTDAPGCASFIEEQLPPNAVIFQTNTAIASAVLAYLNADSFVSLETGNPESYATWVRREPVVKDYDTFCAWAKELAPQAEKVYLLSNTRTPANCKDVLEHVGEDALVYSGDLSPRLPDPSMARRLAECYYLFEIKLP